MKIQKQRIYIENLTQCVLKCVLKAKEVFPNTSKLLILLVESRGIEPLTS